MVKYSLDKKDVDYIFKKITSILKYQGITEENNGVLKFRDHIGKLMNLTGDTVYNQIINNPNPCISEKSLKTLRASIANFFLLIKEAGLFEYEGFSKPQFEKFYSKIANQKIVSPKHQKKQTTTSNKSAEEISKDAVEITRPAWMKEGYYFSYVDDDILGSYEIFFMMSPDNIYIRKVEIDRDDNNQLTVLYRDDRNNEWSGLFIEDENGKKLISILERERTKYENEFNTDYFCDTMVLTLAMPDRKKDHVSVLLGIISGMDEVNEGLVARLVLLSKTQDWVDDDSNMPPNRRTIAKYFQKCTGAVSLKVLNKISTADDLEKLVNSIDR